MDYPTNQQLMEDNSFKGAASAIKPTSKFAHKGQHLDMNYKPEYNRNNIYDRG
jgi:hypothetical protein